MNPSQPEALQHMLRVLGEIPVAVYTKTGTRVVWNEGDPWLDRLPRVWEGHHNYRIEVIYRGEAFAAVGATLEECVTYLLSGVLNIGLPDGKA